MSKHEQVSSINEQFDLGQWLGRRQAFDLMAGKCSAADAECLRNLRDRKLYKSLGLSWDRFCEQHVGISRPLADRLIQHLKEFGPAYFQLSRVVPVSAETYRQIAPAVSEQGLNFEGETITFAPENSRKLLGAVNTLRKQPAKSADRIEALEKRLHACIAQVEETAQAELARDEHLRLDRVVDNALADILVLSLRIRQRACRAA